MKDWHEVARYLELRFGLYARYWPAFAYDLITSKKTAEISIFHVKPCQALFLVFGGNLR
jgi:hypothetical protein